jgi:Kef-type K+ transport system membrane component KefB
VAFAAPFALGLFPRLRLPSVVLEIIAGIVIGPSVLGLVEVDQSIEVVALIGLAFVLFLAGLEIEFDKLRGQAWRCCRSSWPRSSWCAGCPHSSTAASWTPGE